MSTKTLEKWINELCDKLRISGKDKPADYYENLLNKIRYPLNDMDKTEALQQIISSGKISDLANFTAEEDQLFDLAYEEAKRLKNSV